MTNQRRGLSDRYRSPLLILLMLLCGAVAQAQYLQPIPNYGYQWKRGRFDTLFAPPADTLAVPLTLQGLGWYAIKNKVPYVWNPVSHVWESIGGAESDPLYTANGVAKSRTLTINGQAYDLSQNRSWTIQTASGTDSASYHNITPLADSSGYVINRPNGAKDTVQFVGATVTAPTVDTTSLSNRINQKQNISDTATVDATRYWVNSQGFAKQSALQDTASAIRLAIGTGSASGGVLVRAWGDSATIPAATTVDSHRRWTVPANTLAQAGDMLIMRIWFTVNGTESVTINFRATPSGMTPASIVARAGGNLSTVGNEVVMELTRLTATTYSLRTLLQTSGGFPSDQFNIAPASVLDFTKDITFCIGIVTGTTNTAVTPRMVQYRIIKN